MTSLVTWFDSRIPHIPQNPSMVHGLDCYSMVSWDRYPDAEPKQALIVKWYNNGFVTRYPLFDSE